MKVEGAVIDELTVKPGEPADLHGRSTQSTRVSWLGDGGSVRKMAREALLSFVRELEEAQELLWASDTHALLVVLQAMDAAGKDGTIRHVMSGLNPQGCEVTAFKEPSDEALEHDFLWRYHRAVPGRGRIGVFNRSYYEEVLVVRVHPELLGDQAQGASERPPPETLWPERYEDINAFERHLDRERTRIVKIFLHLSKDEQKKRLLERLEDPSKYWKFSMADLTERARWNEYQAAYEEAISATSTLWAPWFVVPADDKHAARALVGGILVDAIDRMGLMLPNVTPDQVEQLTEARDKLRAE